MEFDAVSPVARMIVGRMVDDVDSAELLHGGQREPHDRRGVEPNLVDATARHPVRCDLPGMVGRVRSG
jgi:hypothetical protein